MTLIIDLRPDRAPQRGGPSIHATTLRLYDAVDEVLSAADRFDQLRDELFNQIDPDCYLDR
jgi:hypothetical protein